MHNHWWDDDFDWVEANDRAPQSKALRLLLENLRVAGAQLEAQRIKYNDYTPPGAPPTPAEIAKAADNAMDLEAAWPTCGEGVEPEWWNHEEEDVEYTSKTIVALLTVLLGNETTAGERLGFDLKPLLQQLWAIKLLESNDDIEF